MHNRFRIFRLSNVLKEKDAVHLEQARTTIAEARETLEHSRQTDTFAGRKTQEPFPIEEREVW